ncbi:Interferon-related developmental regulator [Macleaya cordata]|uniref:Interferon-related developmental regulator n=1 Tax=Macleaya cordata TaxID=56857 RepID=A0A200QAQ3_MACCD|nr:Interferon-related developmental regulator [Macleaya cordata]
MKQMRKSSSKAITKKCSRPKKGEVKSDIDDDGASSSSTAMSNLTLGTDKEELESKNKSMDQCLEELFNKRGPTREKALSLLVDGFTKKLQHEFLVNKCITLLYQCLNSVKRGSSKEIHLASRVIGLLSITVGCKDNVAHEILEETFPQLSQALQSGSEPMKISSLLDCLAIITLVGGYDINETEKSMQIMWHFFHPKSGSNMVATKPSPMILKTAILAWSFLLTTMDGWKVNSRSWKESISCFSDLLDHNDLSVRIAAGEAIALIFEIGSLEKFCSEAKGPSEESVHEGNKCQESSIYMERLKGKIVNQVSNLSVEAGDQGLAKKDQRSQQIRDVLEFLEGGFCPKTSIKIGGDVLNISTWSQLLQQVNFMMGFLGAGFVKHMQENEFLHDFFEFKPKKKQNLSGDNHHLSSSEEVVHYFFQPKPRREEECSQRMFKSPNSALNKARTQLLSKKRISSQGKNTGHFAVRYGDEEEA